MKRFSVPGKIERSVELDGLEADENTYLLFYKEGVSGNSYMAFRQRPEKGQGHQTYLLVLDGVRLSENSREELFQSITNSAATLVEDLEKEGMRLHMKKWASLSMNADHVIDNIEAVLLREACKTGTAVSLACLAEYGVTGQQAQDTALRYSTEDVVKALAQRFPKGPPLLGGDRVNAPLTTTYSLNAPGKPAEAGGGTEEVIVSEKINTGLVVELLEDAPLKIKTQTLSGEVGKKSTGPGEPTF